jgi:hypothetical protein
MSALNGTNGLPKSNDDLMWLNYGIRFASPTRPMTVMVGRWEHLQWWLCKWRLTELS